MSVDLNPVAVEDAIRKVWSPRMGNSRKAFAQMRYHLVPVGEEVALCGVRPWKLGWRDEVDGREWRMCSRCEAFAVSRAAVTEKRAGNHGILNPRPILPYLDELMERILPNLALTNDGCLEWTSTCAKNGYGVINLWPVGFLVHRVVMTYVNGCELQPGLVVDHLCRNRCCAMPGHLELVTPKENLKRSPVSPTVVLGSRSHCKYGHPYDANAYFRAGGGRDCKQCVRDAGARYRAKKRKSAAFSAAGVGER